MRRIRIILLSALCTLFFALTANAQELINQAIEFYNKGAAAVQARSWATALNEFDQALAITEKLEEEEAAEMTEKMKDLIPSLYLYLGQELAQATKIDEALVQLNKAIETAQKYDDPGTTAAQAKRLIDQLNMSVATALYNDRKYEEAIAAFGKVLEANPENGTVHMYIGVSQNALGNEAEGIASLEKSVELGIKEAERLLVNIYVRKAAADQTARRWNDVYANAEKALVYDPDNLNGNKLMGAAAFELRRWDAAITAYERVLPLESNPDNTHYNLARAYEGRGNKAKACEHYRKIVNNATFKEFAEAKVKELCN